MPSPGVAAGAFGAGAVACPDATGGRCPSYRMLDDAGSRVLLAPIVTSLPSAIGGYFRAPDQLVDWARLYRRGRLLGALVAFDSAAQRALFVARLRGGVNRSAIAAIADGTRR
ncbi:hypothetical protein GCM10009827_072160 [Dactylosporangium maewongense]|uniref:Uncharacterized protein n=1 Tax=Dactylosporangium maewongense TaxID=634393 RepID=A0ABN2BN56_9ACTN